MESIGSLWYQTLKYTLTKYNSFHLYQKIKTEIPVCLYAVPQSICLGLLFLKIKEKENCT